MKKGLAKVFGVLLAIQLICPVQVLAQAANLDLGSTDRNIQASQHGEFTSAQIQTADGARVVTPTDHLTAAESIALSQVLSGGSQLLLLGASGNAIGGSFQIPTSMANSLNNLVIPSGVTGLQDFGTASTLSLLGNFTNSGNFYGYSSNANVTAANISVNNLFNNANALISTIMPQGGIAGINSLVANLSLNISALNNIVNAGSISSAGNLNMTAGASIINQLPANVMAMLPTIQAMNAVNLSAANIVNAGMISSLFSNLNVATPELLNSGTLQALSSSINVQSALSNLLAVDNNNGVMQARDSIVFSTLGTTFDNEGKVLSKAGLSLNGGNLAAENIHFNSPSGLVNMQAIRVDGPIHVAAGDVALGVQGGTLTVGTMQLTGDPCYTNSGGDVDLVVEGIFSGGSTFSTGGSQFIALASGNVKAVGAPSPGLVDTSSGFNNTTGGLIKIGAGVTWDGSYNITGSTTEGGDVLLPTISFQTNGGNVTIVANEGNVDDGAITVGNINTSGMGGLGVNQSGTGAIHGQSAGDISITSTTTAADISTGYLRAYGGGGGGGGTNGGGTNGGNGGAGGDILVSGLGNADITIAGDINSSGGGGGGSQTTPGTGGSSGSISVFGYSNMNVFTIAGPVLNSSGGNGGSSSGGGSFGGGGGAAANTVGGGGGGFYGGGAATTVSGTQGGNGGGLVGGTGGNGAANGVLGQGGGGANFGETGSSGAGVSIGAVASSGSVSFADMDDLIVSTKISDGFSGSGFTNSDYANVSISSGSFSALTGTSDPFAIAGDIILTNGSTYLHKDSGSLTLLAYGTSGNSITITLSSGHETTALSPDIEYMVDNKLVDMSTSTYVYLDASNASFTLTPNSTLYLTSAERTVEVPQLSLVAGNTVLISGRSVELSGIQATGSGQSVTITSGVSYSASTIDITGSIDMPDGEFLVVPNSSSDIPSTFTATDITAKSIDIGEIVSTTVWGLKSIAADNLVATDGGVSLWISAGSSAASISVDSITATDGDVSVTANPTSSSVSIGIAAITVDNGNVTITTDAGSAAATVTVTDVSVIGGNIDVTAESGSSTAIVTVTKAYTTSGDISLYSYGSNSSSYLSSKIIASDDGDITLKTETGNLYITPNGRITSVDGNVNLQIADSGTVGSDGIEVGANSVISAYSASPSGSAGNVYIFIGSSPPPENAGSAPTNVSGSTSSGGTIYYGTSGFTGSSPTNYIHAKTGEVVFDTDGVSSSKILLDGGVIINSNVPQITSLDLSNSTAVATVVALQGLGLVGGTLTVGGGGAATGGNAIVDPRDLAVAPLTALKLPGSVTLTMSNFTSDDSLNVAITASSTASQVYLDSGAVLQFTGSSPSVANLNIRSTETGPAFFSYYSTTLSSDGSLNVTLDGSFLTYNNVTATTTVNMETTANNGYFHIVGTLTAGGAVAFITQGTGNISIGIVTTSNDNLTLNSGGLIAIGPVSTGSGDINMTAVGNIQFYSGNDPLTLNSSSSIHSTNGDLILTVSSLTNAGEIITDKSSGDITISMFNAAGTLTNNGLIKTSQSSGYIQIGTWDDPLTVAGNGTFDAGSGGTVSFTTAAGAPIDFSGTHDFVVGSTGGVGINGSELTFADDTSLSSTAGIGMSAATLIDLGSDVTIHCDTTSGEALTLYNNSSSVLAVRVKDDSSANLSTDGGNIRIYNNTAGLTFSKTTGGNIGTLNATGGHLYLTNHGVGTIALTVNAGVVIASDSDIDISVSKSSGTSTLVNNGTITTDKNGGAINIGTNGGGGYIFNMDGTGTFSVTGASGTNSVSLVSYGNELNFIGDTTFDVTSTGTVSLNNSSGDQTISGSITSDGALSIYSNGELNSSGTISAKSVSIGSASDLTVGSVESTNGSISIVATTGVLTVSAGAVIDATEGNITIRNADTSSGSIFIGNGAEINAYGDQDFSLGEVYIVIGTVPGSPVAGSTPGGFTLNTSNGGAGYFGTNGIDILSGSNVGNVDGSRLIFNTGSLSSSAISLDGDVTINATSYTSYKSEPDDEDILDEHSDTLKLVSFIRPSLNNSAELTDGICTLRNDCAVVKHLGNAKVVGLDDQSLKLTRGHVLLKTDQDTTVKVGGHIVEIARGVIVGISNIDGVLKVHNILDNGHGDISIRVNLAETVTLLPGQEATISRSQEANYQSMQADKLARRATKTFKVKNNYVVTKSDFSHISYIKNYPLMKQLVASSDGSDKDMVNNIVKMAASIMTVTAGKGTYVSVKK